MEAFVPVKAVTSSPGFHWFGYYDKLQFDQSQRYLLSMAVDFEGRSPRADDVIQLGLIDLEDGNRWTDIAQTRSWCWQQGCMLQWVPGKDRTVIWNDRDGDRFVAYMMDLDKGETVKLPRAVYALSPDGKKAVAPDFRRVNHLRPGYGYTGIPDPNEKRPAPDDSGIWLIDLDQGTEELIIAVDQISRFEFDTDQQPHSMHYFNHLLVNTDGSRFEFLHRWRPIMENAQLAGFRTRMLTADMDGSNLRVVDGSGRTSHFIWKDSHHILAYTKPDGEEYAFYLFDERDGSYICELGERLNGHCTYLPGSEWILNDTYPQGEGRSQDLYLYNINSEKRIPLGSFPAPPAYEGEWRCDLHPRFSPDGTMVCIDSAHENGRRPGRRPGRQLYLLDVAEIVK